MADLYAVVHRDAGPVASFTTWPEADEERQRMLDDEPGWVDDLWIEEFRVVVAESR